MGLGRKKRIDLALGRVRGDGKGMLRKASKRSFS